MTKEAALKLALEALDDMHIVDFPLEDLRNWNKAITAIKEALAQPDHIRDATKMMAQPVQEPFAWFHYLDFRMIHHEVWLELIEGQGDWIPLYTAPPQRTWVGLTPEEVMESWEEIRDGDWAPDFYAVIEAKLKEKNT